MLTGLSVSTAPFPRFGFVSFRAQIPIDLRVQQLAQLVRALLLQRLIVQFLLFQILFFVQAKHLPLSGFPAVSAAV